MVHGSKKKKLEQASTLAPWEESVSEPGRSSTLSASVGQVTDDSRTDYSVVKSASRFPRAAILLVVLVSAGLGAGVVYMLQSDGRPHAPLETHTAASGNPKASPPSRPAGKPAKVEKKKTSVAAAVPDKKSLTTKAKAKVKKREETRIQPKTKLAVKSAPKAKPAIKSPPKAPVRRPPKRKPIKYGSLKVGTLFEGTPVWADVYVDGQKKGTSPTLVEKVRPGRHMVEVRRDGYRTRSRKVRVKPGKTTPVIIELKR